MAEALPRRRSGTHLALGVANMSLPTSPRTFHAPSASFEVKMRPPRRSLPLTSLLLVALVPAVLPACMADDGDPDPIRVMDPVDPADAFDEYYASTLDSAAVFRSFSTPGGTLSTSGRSMKFVIDNQLSAL